MDVVKVNQYVTHIAYFASISEEYCKRLFKMYHLFQMYVAVSVLYGCYIYFTHMLQIFFISMLHMFHTHVASILSGYCICFIHMSQQYVSSVSSVSDVYCI
jgi:hypothetical protein